MADTEQDDKMHYMIFRAVAAPSSDYRNFDGPIRYDPVTVVEADAPQEAVEAVIAATGTVSLSFAACECTMHGFSSRQHVGEGGELVAGKQGKAKQLEKENDERYERIKDDLDKLREM